MNGNEESINKRFVIEDHNSIYIMVVATICSITILQKISVGNALFSGIEIFSVTTALLPILIFYGLISGKLIIDKQSFGCFCVFAFFSCCSIFLNDIRSNVSLSSFLLIMVIQSSLMFVKSRIRVISADNEAIFKKFMLLLSVLGIIQFFAQFFIGVEYSFPIDYFFPKSFMVPLGEDGFKNLTPLSYGSTTLKSNGIVFAEPSIFCQFAAIAAVVELSSSKRIPYIMVYIAAMFCSFSGTGFIILGMYGIYWLKNNVNIKILLLIIVLASIFAVYGSVLQAELFYGRIEEFSTPGSSGYARFISPFDIARAYSFDSMTTMFFGRGPGTISAYSHKFPYETFDPTYFKLFFEYGMLGFISYMLYIFSCFRNTRSRIVVPLLINYFFMGGYLANASVVAILVIFISWSGDKDHCIMRDVS